MLYRNAADGVMKTSVAFFDTTPLGLHSFLYSSISTYPNVQGRITSRFSKDQDDLDGMLPFLFSQVCPFFLLLLRLSQAIVDIYYRNTVSYFYIHILVTPNREHSTGYGCVGVLHVSVLGYSVRSVGIIVLRCFRVLSAHEFGMQTIGFHPKIWVVQFVQR